MTRARVHAVYGEVRGTREINEDERTIDVATRLAPRSSGP